MANITIEESLIPISTARPGIKRVGFAGVTIHETANYRRTADARSHAAYMQGAGRHAQVSSHYYVDDARGVRCIPEGEVAWHASDGRTTPGGNMSTVAIEICTNWGYTPPELAGYQSLPGASGVSAADKTAAMARFAKAVENAAALAADILYRQGAVTTDGMVRQHNTWDTKNRKDCPHNIRKGIPLSWDAFVAMTQWKLAALCGQGKDGTPPAPAAGSGGGANASTGAGTNTGSGTTSTTLYHVQVGAFSAKKNADAFSLAVKRAGFSAYVKQEGSLYHVQVGAFSTRAAAGRYAKQVQQAGFTAIVK